MEGIDDSHWRGKVNWFAVRHLARKGFAFSQATEGLGYIDPQFGRNWRLSRVRGLIRGAIHFLHPSESGVRQAEFLHHVVRQAGGMVPGDWLILEVEASDGQNPQRIGAACEEFACEVIDYRSPTGDRHVALYSGDWFWNARGVVPGPYTKRLKQWVASYGAAIPDRLNGFPTPPHIWQYTSSGRCAGVTSPVDLDRTLGNFDLRG